MQTTAAVNRLQNRFRCVFVLTLYNVYYLFLANDRFDIGIAGPISKCDGPVTNVGLYVGCSLG